MIPQCSPHRDTASALPQAVLRLFIVGLLAAAAWGVNSALGVDSATAVGQQPEDAAPPAIPIGAAKLDVTPRHPVRLTGYSGRRAETASVAQPLWVKALAIGADRAAGSEASEDGPAILLTLENCGLTPAIRRAVVAALSAQAGIRDERIVIAVSHTHSAPALRDWAPFLFAEELPADHQKHIDDYTDEVVQRLIQVARDALAARRPGRLSWGQGRIGFAANRRRLEAGRWAGFGVQPDGPVDHSLPVLAARDTRGELIAVVANYACHCTTLSGDFQQIAGDWAGYAQEMIEADHPGSIALITIGCGADANPEPRRSDLALCRQHGRSLADEVKRLLAGPLQPLDPRLSCRLRQIELPFEALPTRRQWEERVKEPGAQGYHARRFLAKLDQGETLPNTLSYPIAVWTFGDGPAAAARSGRQLGSQSSPQPSQQPSQQSSPQSGQQSGSQSSPQSRPQPADLAMVFLGGEVVVDFAIRFKDEFDGSRLWLTAYANDVCCYIPSRRVLREGGYEAEQSMWLYARPARLADNSEDLISDTVMKLIPSWFYPAEKQADLPPPKSPADALAAIKVKPGFRVELVAAEPLVEDPVAFDWGPDGRLWVVEMRDYPNGLTWNGPGDPKNVPGGRVKVLRDTDGDGRYDKATVFLDGLPFPNGVKAWRGGVLVTAAPQVLYAEDHDGDDKADQRVMLFAGFTEGNQQHRANGLRWGLDNWLYMANGDSGGSIKSLANGSVLKISGRDLRVRPDTGELDPQAGQTQFGRCRTDWGDWFGGNNANPMWHYVLEDHYLRRNPHVAPPENRKHVSIKPGASPVYPLSKTLTRFNDFNMSNRFTSACSPEVYRDDWPHIGLAAETHVFICEPVHNLVHHEVMTADGATFTSRRAADEQESEFFASSDNWCRPVMVRTGPDGAIWIADMYRAVIEHPEWIPQNWQRKLDLRAGSTLGRIYRVVADTPKAAERRVPRFDKLVGADAVAELVAALASPNGWQRDTVQQLLVERFGPAPQPPLAAALRDGGRGPVDEATRKRAIELLEAMAQGHALPVARLHALCALDGIGGLRADVVMAAMADAHAGLRRQAVRLAEPFLASPATASVIGASLVRAASDADPAVRLQTAYALGAWDERGGAPLAQLALRHPADPYLQAAVLSSVHRGNLRSVLTAVFAESADSPPARLVDPLLATAAGWNARGILDETLAAIAKPASAKPANAKPASAKPASMNPAAANPASTKPVAASGTEPRYAQWQLTALSGFLDAIERRNIALESLVAPETRQQIDLLLSEARLAAGNAELPDERRIAAVRLVGRSTLGSDGRTNRQPTADVDGVLGHRSVIEANLGLLVSLLSSRNSPELQSAAIQSLSRFRGSEVASRCMEDWRSHSPAVRSMLLDLLMSRDDGTEALLAAVSNGQIPPAQIDARRRQQLLTYRRLELRELAAKVLAAKVFAGTSEPSRQKVLDAYRGSLSLAGNAGRGKAAFAKRCSVCHRLDGQGHHVGPDIASLGNKSPESLLVAILDPNRAIEDRYMDYVVETVEGRALTGMLGSETSTSVALLAPEGKSTVVLRNQIELLRSTGKSLMPEGLERELTVQDCADLFAYLRQSGQPLKTFPGNKPETVTADETGAIRLLATTARIYGPRLVFEETYRNLGYWATMADRAEWSLVVPKAGRYRVTLDYACPNDVAGNRFVVQVGGQALEGKVQGTGGWDNYSGKSVGTVDIPAGPTELVMRSEGPVQSALLDLRGIRLTPTP